MAPRGSDAAAADLDLDDPRTLEFIACQAAVRKLRPRLFASDGENLEAIEENRAWERWASYAERDAVPWDGIECPENELRRLYEQQRELGQR